MAGTLILFVAILIGWGLYAGFQALIHDPEHERKYGDPKVIRPAEVHFPSYVSGHRYYPRHQSLPYGWSKGQFLGAVLGAGAVAHSIHEHYESERIQDYWNTERINDYYDFGHHDL